MVELPEIARRREAVADVQRIPDIHTLVTVGSDEVIDQISKQLGKLVDVVNIVDMTQGDHIARELALFKLHIDATKRDELESLVGEASRKR